MSTTGYKTYKWIGAGNCVTPSGRLVTFDRNGHFTTDEPKLQEELDELTKGQHLEEVPETAVVMADSDNTDTKEGEQEIKPVEGLESTGGVEQAPIHQDGMTASTKGVVSSAALAAAAAAAAAKAAK